MAQPNRTLVLTLTAVTDKFRKGIGDAEDSLGGFSNKLGNFAKTSAVAIAAIGVAAGALAIKLGKDAINAASDLSEELSKSSAVFGDSAAAIDEWAKGAANAFGQSRKQATAAASTFAIFGKSAGLSDDELVGFSTELSELASDLASFNNTSPEDAIQALGAALRGESEPIRRYQVLLDDATLRNRALEMGLISTTKNALTPQQRVLAAHAEIMAQTVIQQGDFIKTSDGLANSQRILEGNLEDVKTTIGEALLPVAVEFAGWLKGVLPDVISFAEEMGEKLGPAVAQVGDFIKNRLLPFARDVWPHIRDFAIFTKDLVTAIADFVREEIAPRFVELIERLAEPAANAWAAVRELGKATSELTASIKAANPEGSLLLDWLFKLEALKWDYILDKVETLSNLLAGIVRFADRLAEFAGGNVLDLPSMGAAELPPGFVPGQTLPNARGTSMTVNNNVTITGAIDKEGAAREVRRILGDSDRRTGFVATVPLAVR